MRSETNPFMVNIGVAKIHAVQCYSKEKYIQSDSIKVEDGIALPIDDSFKGADLSSNFLVDRENRCFVYQGKPSKEIVRKLDSMGRAMFLYVQYNLGKNSDVIKLTLEEYADFWDYSPKASKTFYDAVNQLMGAGVIQRKKANNFWVNPMIIFNGNRIDKYPNNVEVVAKVNLKSLK